MKTAYIFGLFENGEEIDRTSLDENNVNLASDLFFGEFGHHNCKHMGVALIEEVEEDD